MQSVMKKSLAVLLAAGTIAVASVAAPAPAEARHRGGAVAAGIIGGLALGAIASGAYGGYYGGPYYGYRRSYYGPDPYYGAYAAPVYYGRRCHTERRWVSTYYGERLRRVRVCY